MIPQKSFAKRESIYDLIAQQGCADYEEIHQLIKKAQTLASIAPIGCSQHRLSSRQDLPRILDSAIS
jgi:hypothetical protein